MSNEFCAFSFCVFFCFFVLAFCWIILNASVGIEQSQWKKLMVFIWCLNEKKTFLCHKQKLCVDYVRFVLISLHQQIKCSFCCFLSCSLQSRVFIGADAKWMVCANVFNKISILFSDRTIHWFGLFDMAVACTNTAYHNIYAANGIRTANLSIIVFSIYL